MSARAGVAIAAPSSKPARTSPRRNTRRFPEPYRERWCELVMAVPPRGDAGSWSTDGDGGGVRWFTRAGESGRVVGGERTWRLVRTKEGGDFFAAGERDAIARSYRRGAK